VYAIGGCDPPQPPSIAVAAQIPNAQRLKSKLFIHLTPRSMNGSAAENLLRCFKRRRFHSLNEKTVPSPFAPPSEVVP
jgi:hypothetical protein